MTSSDSCYFHNFGYVQVGIAWAFILLISTLLNKEKEVVGGNRSIELTMLSNLTAALGFGETSQHCQSNTIVSVLNHTLGKLLDSDWLKDCEFICNLRANTVIRGKLRISRAEICNSF